MDGEMPDHPDAEIRKLQQNLIRKRQKHDRLWIAIFEQELKVREQEMVGELDGAAPNCDTD
jgi:hypothetical protein